MVRPSRRRWYRSIESKVPVGQGEPGSASREYPGPTLQPTLRAGRVRRIGDRRRAARGPDPVGEMRKGEDASHEAPPPWSRGPELNGSPSCVVKRPAAGRGVCRRVPGCVQYLRTRPNPPGPHRSPRLSWRPRHETVLPHTEAGSFRSSSALVAGLAGSQMLNAAPRSAAHGSSTRSPSIARQSSRETYRPSPLPSSAFCALPRAN